MKIRKGDRVQVIAGHSKGLVGDVVAVLPRSNRVIVEAIHAYQDKFSERTGKKEKNKKG